MASGCGRSGDSDSAPPTTGAPGATATGVPPIAGQPIRTLSAVTNTAPNAVTNAGPSSVSAAGLGVATNGAATAMEIPDAPADGSPTRLTFGALASFPYRVYEYFAEGVSGRPLLKSDDSIPEVIRKLDGRRVILQGFVLPLRTRRGQVTEFLLLKDQGTCCFGPQAQINHFVRVTARKGHTFESGLAYQVTGQLRVGETYVQGYLTGIYQLEAEAVGPVAAAKGL